MDIETLTRKVTEERDESEAECDRLLTDRPSDTIAYAAHLAWASAMDKVLTWIEELDA